VTEFLDLDDLERKARHAIAAGHGYSLFWHEAALKLICRLRAAETLVGAQRGAVEVLADPPRLAIPSALDRAFGSAPDFPEETAEPCSCDESIALRRRVAELDADLTAYRRAFGPLVAGAEPVKCFACARASEQQAALTVTAAVPPGPLAEALSKVCLCEGCGTATECSFIERTGQPSGWLCKECDDQIRRDQAAEAAADRIWP
jgi:hypothetical protein